MTSPRTALIAALCALATFVPALPALAQNQADKLETFRYWTAWKGRDANGEICFISSQPQTVAPEGLRRSEIHFLVIQRKYLGTRNEVQTQIGYPFNTSNENSRVAPEGERIWLNAWATIDGKRYQFMTVGENAWLADEDEEPAFVEALKAGSQLVVQGISHRDNTTTDTYSLSGVTAALEKLDEECR